MLMLKRIQLEEVAVVLTLMFFGLAGFIPGIAPNQNSEMTGIAATRLQAVVGIGSQMLVNLLMLFLIVKQRRLLMQRAAELRWAMALAVWAICSVLWSQNPATTARRSIPLALAAVFAAYLSLRFPMRRTLALLQAALGLLAIWSAALALAFPRIGLDASTGHGGDWQGVFTQKNACGRAMVFALTAVLASGRLTSGRALLLLLFSAELWLSGSRGAWVLGAVLVGALLLFRASCGFDRPTRTAMLALTAALAAGMAGAAYLWFPALAEMLGRDPTLTGRTQIWSQVWLSILQRPFLGYGFSGFWQGAQGASWNVVIALKFVLFHAHNGFLELWLELGAVGLLLFSAGFIRAGVLLWPKLRAGRFTDAAWPLAVLLLIVLYDFDENTLLEFNGLFWVLYSAALVRIDLLAAERRTIASAVLRPPNPTPWLFPTSPPTRLALTADSSGSGQTIMAPALLGSGDRSPWLRVKEGSWL